MGALVAIVLVCAASVPLQDCTRDTAQDVVVLPGAPTPTACLQASLLTLARDPGRLADGAYPRTMCEHRKG